MQFTVYDWGFQHGSISEWNHKISANSNTRAIRGATILVASANDSHIRDFIEIGSVVLFRNRVDLEGTLHEMTGYETVSRPIVFGIVAKSSQHAKLTI